jgi:lipopolysaccharide export system protein LptA
MTASSQENTAIFRENVKMVQEELVVHSDIMIVYFKEKTDQTPSPVGQLPSENSKKEIRVIEARGHVKIAKGESRAICTRALYDKLEERIILLGSPVVWQAGTRVSGQKITMFLKENRSVVEGDTRVTIEEGAEN